MENNEKAVPDFIEVPAGTFVQGSTPEEVEKAVALRAGWMKEEPQRQEMTARETPQREVTLTQPFHMGILPVTVAQFRSFVEDTGYETESQHNGRGGAFYDKGTFRESMDFTWENPLPNYKAADGEPVTQVTWNDAWAYCQWLGHQLGKNCQLPTEAQWEYACLGKNREWSGMGKEFLDPIAIHSAEDAGVCGQLKANSYGLHDMLGNVWEWVSDYAWTDWDAEAVKDPTGPVTGEARIRRGGSFSSPLNQLRAAYRKWSPPIYRGRIVGFRACILPE